MYVIGTAGHVDHGKSTLVKALTGIDPDRLPQEKEREMTIDLGFAWLTLPSGREVSIVDVPGHERFIKNMLAGVGGIDMALLVVAADESVMPQTREHLAILDILRVKRGLVVITKSDLVDEELLELVGVEVEDALRGTTFEGSSMVAVSAFSGRGLDELKGTIDAMLDATEPRRKPGPPQVASGPVLYRGWIWHSGDRHPYRWEPLDGTGSPAADLRGEMSCPGSAEPQKKAGSCRSGAAARGQPLGYLQRRHPAGRADYHSRLAEADFPAGRPAEAGGGRATSSEAQRRDNLSPVHRGDPWQGPPSGPGRAQAR